MNETNIEQEKPAITEEQKNIIFKKEIKSLKNYKYNTNIKKFPNSYLICNKKTGVIVEINAASSMHACKIIGWNPRRVSVIDVIDLKAKEKVLDIVDQK